MALKQSLHPRTIGAHPLALFLERLDLAAQRPVMEERESSQLRVQARQGMRALHVLELELVPVRLGRREIPLDRHVRLGTRQRHVGVHLLEFLVEGLGTGEQ